VYRHSQIERDDTVNGERAILQSLVQELAFWRMPLPLLAYNHIDGTASKIPPRIKGGLSLPPYDQGAQIRKSKYFVEADNREIWRGLGVI
jgi:hypothetical protein